ncbi:MAG TPA: hypothetical protein VFS77_08895 [Pyrinomonadaceae bacterium]|nr:hypothetical protein [Pyrinomonadaceae bacterium]
MKKVSVITALVVMMFASGCAHRINITPPLNTISAEGTTKIDKTVGYYISKEQRDLLITSKGGGGDKVTYLPYAESEPALNQVLSNVYAKVVSLSAPNDKAELESKQVAYVFTPTITTTSKSSSAFTWPPTNFTVTIDCKTADGTGASVWSKQVTGIGDAEFAEFKHDFSLAARRASKDAFNQLQKEIVGANALK